MTNLKNLTLVFICSFSLTVLADPAPPTAAPLPAPTSPVPGPAELRPTERPATAGFYYYCEKLRAYYPTAPNCPDGWIAIPVGPPPPMPVRSWPEPVSAEAMELARSRRNSITMELSGRALEYSVDYARAISQHLTLGAGISSWEMSAHWWDYHATVTVVPVYANYYFNENVRRGFLTAGADWITVSHSGYDNSTFTNNGFAAVVGGGYEYRDTSGFILRLAGYVIVGRSVIVNPGVGFGVSF